MFVASVLRNFVISNTYSSKSMSQAVFMHRITFHPLYPKVFNHGHNVIPPWPLALLTTQTARTSLVTPVYKYILLHSPLIIWQSMDFLFQSWAQFKLIISVLREPTKGEPSTRPQSSLHGVFVSLHPLVRWRKKTTRVLSACSSSLRLEVHVRSVAWH